MKKIFTCIALGICSIELHAQNVGINTTSPQASLDVRGSQRVGGINNYTRFDSATGRIEWIGAALYAPTSQQVIRHSASSEGLYAGGGRLEYRNATAPVFYSDWTSGNGYFKNRLGINNPNPQFPLSMDGSLGDKISLWTDGTATHYGLGIQSGLLQIFSKTSSDDIAFGYGSSTTFTERMRIKGNGNVGIGNSNPQFPLEVNGRARLWGTNPNDPGIWLNDAGVDRGFVGLQNNTHIGLYGTGVGWGLTMNTNSGALEVNGSEGSAGQVMKVNESSGAAQWASIASVLPSYYVQNSILGTAFVDVPGPGEYALYNGTININVAGNSRLIISANYSNYTFCPPVGGCNGQGGYYFKVDGNSTEPNSMVVQGGGGFSSGSLANYFYDVGPGAHSIVFYTRPVSGSTHYSAFLVSATVIVMKQ